jgi:DNA repair protein RadC
MDRVGADKMTDAALLAIIMRSGARGCNVVDLAKRLLKDNDGSLTELSRRSVEELARDGRYPGLGRVKAQCLRAALEIGKRMTREAMGEKVAVRTPEDVFGILETEAQALDTEVFWVLHLDAKNRLSGRPREVTRGVLDASLVHPREVFSEAIRARCARVVLAHNHPSGDLTPSSEDLRITRQLVESGRVLDIKVLDHVVVGRRREGRERPFLSMREEGLTSFE